MQTSITEYTVPMEKNKIEIIDLSGDNKKMLTKGAMKIFEGLKVSIPTEDLNMAEVLNCSPTSKKMEAANEKQSTKEEKEKQVEDKPTRYIKPKMINKGSFKKFGNKLGLKVTKKKQMNSNSRRTKTKTDLEKMHDVYDFEETQDNTDVFPKNITDLKTFRTQSKVYVGENVQVDKTKASEIESDCDSNRLGGSFSFEAQSISSFSTESSASLKKSKPKNLTKKKCMIMGRIFKNAFKSKAGDVIPEIPSLDHSKLVENYVMNCPADVSEEKRTKMSNQEMDILFNQLLEDHPSKTTDSTVISEISKPETSKKLIKLKPPKNRKRHRINEDSSDDEFNINSNPRKRSSKKNNKNDNGINLEQELKECIGVASRKSQRKCTSGKQNVLVEFWSSDESNFEAALEQAYLISKAATSVEASKEEKLPEPPIEPIKKLPQLLPPVAIVEKPAKIEEKTEKPKRRKSCAKQAKTKDKQDKQFQKRLPKEFVVDSLVATRKKRAASDTLYYWSSSSDDEFQDLIEVKPIREEDDEDRPMQHGWIVGDSPKKLVTMLAQAKGKKLDTECVKEQNKKRTTI